MSELQDNCKHEEIKTDHYYAWCAHCGLTRRRQEVEGINYDD